MRDAAAWRAVDLAPQRGAFTFHRRGPLTPGGLASYFGRAIVACAPLLGVGAPRRAIWYTEARCSCCYNYGGATLTSTPMDMWMREVVDQIIPLCGLEPDDGPNSCHLACYPDGRATVGWHADDEALFGAPGQPRAIVSLSLGAARPFRIRCRKG